MFPRPERAYARDVHRFQEPRGLPALVHDSKVPQHLNEHKKTNELPATIEAAQALWPWDEASSENWFLLLGFLIDYLANNSDQATPPTAQEAKEWKVFWAKCADDGFSLPDIEPTEIKLSPIWTQPQYDVLPAAERLSRAWNMLIFAQRDFRRKRVVGGNKLTPREHLKKSWSQFWSQKSILDDLDCIANTPEWMKPKEELASLRDLNDQLHPPEKDITITIVPDIRTSTRDTEDSELFEIRKEQLEGKGEWAEYVVEQQVSVPSVHLRSGQAFRDYLRMQLHSEQLYAKLTRLVLQAEGDRPARILYNAKIAVQPSWTDVLKPLLTDTDGPITIRYMFDLLDEDELKRQDRFNIRDDLGFECNDFDIWST